MHGNYDGGAGAGLEDLWNAIINHPYGAGGFIWVFADGGIRRVDEDSTMDTADDSAPDGILGPHRDSLAVPEDHQLPGKHIFHVGMQRRTPGVTAVVR